MNRASRYGDPLLRKRIRVPESLCTEALVGDRQRRSAGDVRVGDLRGSGETDFLVYRSGTWPNTPYPLAADALRRRRPAARQYKRRLID